MLKWLARQRQQLHGFYRDGFGRAFGMTALAFAVVMVVSYLVTLRYPAPIERLIELFREQIADRGIVDAEGNFSALGLFLNNLQACALAMGYEHQEHRHQIDHGDDGEHHRQQGLTALSAAQSIGSDHCCTSLRRLA